MSPLSFKVLEQVDLHAPNGRTVAELINTLERPREEIEASVSALKHANVLKQSPDARWHRVRAGRLAAALEAAPVSDRLFPNVIKRGERRECVACHVAKGATAFNSGDLMCRSCRNHGYTDPPEGTPVPTPKRVVPEPLGVTTLEPTPRANATRELIEPVTVTTVTGSRPRWVDAAISDLRLKLAAVEAERRSLDEALATILRLYGDVP